MFTVTSQALIFCVKNWCKKKEKLFVQKDQKYWCTEKKSKIFGVKNGCKKISVKNAKILV